MFYVHVLYVTIHTVICVCLIIYASRFLGLCQFVKQKAKAMAGDIPPLPKTFIGSAILQLLAGAVALNAGTLALIWDCTLGYIATGIWVGAIVVITSLIGVLTTVYRDRPWVISYLSLSAFSSLLGITLLSVEMSAFYVDSQNCEKLPYSCDTQCLRLHEFNVGSAALEIFAAIGAMALCIQNLVTYAKVPYSKLQKHTNI